MINKITLRSLFWKKCLIALIISGLFLSLTHSHELIEDTADHAPCISCHLQTDLQSTVSLASTPLPVFDFESRLVPLIIRKEAIRFNVANSRGPPQVS